MDFHTNIIVYLYNEEDFDQFLLDSKLFSAKKHSRVIFFIKL